MTGDQYRPVAPLPELLARFRAATADAAATRDGGSTDEEIAALTEAVEVAAQIIAHHLHDTPSPTAQEGPRP